MQELRRRKREREREWVEGVTARKKNCTRRNRCLSVSERTSGLPESFSSSNTVRISLRDITIATDAAVAIVTCHKIRAA